MTMSRELSYVRIGTLPWTTAITFRGPGGSQESVALSTGPRAVFPSRRNFIATGRYRRHSRPNSSLGAETVFQDRRSVESGCDHPPKRRLATYSASAAALDTFRLFIVPG